jgi:trehalose-phosphatase
MSATTLPEVTSEYLLTSTGGAPIVFLDYDGTLAPIVDQPDKAFISEDTRAALSALAASKRPVAIISGRSNEKLKDFLQLDSLYFAGSHGVNIVGPRGRAIDGPDPAAMVGAEALAALDAARMQLDAALGGIPGYLTENNVFCITSHYRMVPAEKHGLVRDTVDAVLSEHKEHLVRRDGKMVHELRPAIAWDKGKAVAWLLRFFSSGDDHAADCAAAGQGASSAAAAAAAAAEAQSAAPAAAPAAAAVAVAAAATAPTANGAGSPMAEQSIPIYLGDDVADEDAFRAVAAAGGIGIKVAEGPVQSDSTAATYFLPQTKVASLLHALAASPVGPVS